MVPRPTSGRLRRVFASRSVLLVFGYLAVTWFLPELVSALAPGEVDVLRPLLQVLAVPAYLLNAFVYDGGLEALAYPVADALPVGGLVWDAGLLLVFYGFAVFTGALARYLHAWSGRESRGFAAAAGHVLVAVLLAMGVVLTLGGAVTLLLNPTVTVTSCSASASASESGGATAATEECVQREVPNTFPNYATVAGVVLLALAGGGMTLDRLLVRRPP